MFEKLFNIYLFKNEKIKNFQFLNHHEILNQLSYIDFENIYLNIDTLINTNKIFDWTEFNPNINNSVMFEFLKKTKEFNLNFIYNGYILKSIFYILLKNFSIKSIPFQTIYNIKTWKENQKNLNIDLSYQLQKQKINEVDINKFSYIFSEISFLYNECYGLDEINILYRVIYHYFQTVLNNKDFNYILDQKKFFARYQCTKKINKSIYIKNSIAHNLFTSFLYKYKIISESNDYLSIKEMDKINYLENLIEETFVFDKKDIEYLNSQKNINKIETNNKTISNYKLDNYYEYEKLNYEDFSDKEQFVSNSHNSSSDWSYSLLDSAVENKNENDNNFDENLFENEEYKSFFDK